MIIFLDFDGVLCTGRQAVAMKERGLIANLDPVALMFLNRICREYGCRVVISSTWRHGKKRRHFYELFMAGGHVDLAKAIHEAWETPVLPDGKRGHEIQAWIDGHGDGLNYIIIDDDSDMLEHQRDRFIHTDSYNGMLMEHYIAAEKLLNAVS